MKCVYCDKVKPNSEVITDCVRYASGEVAQFTYAICLDCTIDIWEVDRNTL